MTDLEAEVVIVCGLLLGFGVVFVYLFLTRLVPPRRKIFKSLFRVVFPPKLDPRQVLRLAQAQYGQIYRLHTQTTNDPTRTWYETEQYSVLLNAIRNDMKTLEEIISGDRAEDDDSLSDDHEIRRIAFSITERDTGPLPEIRCMVGYSPSREQEANDRACAAQVDTLVTLGYTASINEEGGLVLSPEDSSKNSEPAKDIDRLLEERLESLAPEGRRNRPE